MKRIERIEQELKDVIKLRIENIKKLLDEESNLPADIKTWLDVDSLKKFEDVSWAREQYMKWMIPVVVGLASDLSALQSLHEAQDKFHEKPRRGYRKL